MRLHPEQEELQAAEGYKGRIILPRGVAAAACSRWWELGWIPSGYMVHAYETVKE